MTCLNDEYENSLCENKILKIPEITSQRSCWKRNKRTVKTDKK